MQSMPLRRTTALLAASVTAVGLLAAVPAAAETTALLAASVTAVGLLAAVPAAAETAAVAGAASAGDPYFPQQGNGGYDVQHYGLHVTWNTTQVLSGAARINAVATQTLSRFDLDLQPNLTVRSARVNGRPAVAQQTNGSQELVITPSADLPMGKSFTVDVTYRAVAKNIFDPDGSPDGWIPTDDGVFVASEPQGSPTWFPVNDTPRDKATYAVSITVPKGLVGVSNGDLVGRRDAKNRTTWSWRLDQPVSSYLVTATIGRFDLHTGTTPSGIPYFTAVDPQVAAAADPVLRKLPAIVDYFAKKYGRYPFGQTGAIVDNAPRVGYALETATRPLFDRAPDVATLSHELAHQWYGDGVTLARWRDIWLNEGFAEFSSWLWDEHTGGRTTAQHLADLLAKPASDTDEWLPPPGNPGSAEDIFSGSVYDRGAATLAALREKVGDRTFFTIMRGWYAKHVYGNATVKQFTTYASSVAAQDLTGFFRSWLYAPRKPHL